MTKNEYFTDLKNNKNNLSYWYPKFKGCGIRMPETITFQCPDEVMEAFFMENQKKDSDTVFGFVKEMVIPELRKRPALAPIAFMKNGTFSDKYDAGLCHVHYFDAMEITSKLININYDAL